MTERITHTTVTFVHPFELAGVDGLQPPGTYDVETVEEQIGGLSFEAYRRLSTTITIVRASRGPHVRQVTTIDPADLATALAKDAEITHGHA
jgi:hypothetical protein